MEDGAKLEMMEKALADTDGVKKAAAAAAGMMTFFVVESIEETLEVGVFLLGASVWFGVVGAWWKCRERVR